MKEAQLFEQDLQRAAALMHDAPEMAQAIIDDITDYINSQA